MHYLYKITDMLNNKIYIGQTNNPSKRWSYHKNQALKNKPLQYIHRAMAKYGINNFQFETITICKTSEDADYTETVLIAQNDSRNKDKGYNRAPGGHVAWQSGLPSHMYSMYGKHHTEISKQQIRNTLIGKIYSDDAKNKMSLSAKNRHMKGNVTSKAANKKWKRMTYEKAEQIRNEYRAGGISFSQLSVKYNCSIGNISSIINNKSHKSKNDS